MKRYFGYVRVSTVKQGREGASLPQQRAAIEEYARHHNLVIVEWFEEMETAVKLGRPIFTRMLAALEEGGADGVITHKIDRSARNLRDWARLGELIDRGVEMHFAHESIDLTSRGGRLSADIQAVVAADYVRNLRQEVVKGLYGRLAQGVWPWPAPVGYLNRGKGKPKEIDPVKGPLVREAFRLYATRRYNFNSLATELHRIGLRTSTGKRLSKNGLTHLLNNPFYIGLMRVGRQNTLYRGLHDGLIPKSLFDQVQGVLHGRTNAKIIRHDFLFRRMVTCGYCGYALVGERQKGHVYYRCHTRGCQTRCVRELAIQAQVQQILEPAKFEPAELAALSEELAALRDEWVLTREDHIRSARLAVAAIDERLTRLADALLDLAIDRESYGQRRSSLLHERASAVERLQVITAEATTPAGDLGKFLEQVSNLWLTYKNALPYEKRELLSFATSNLRVQGKNVVVELREPFRIVAQHCKLIDCAPSQDEVRASMKAMMMLLWQHFTTPAVAPSTVARERRR